MKSLLLSKTSYCIALLLFSFLLVACNKPKKKTFAGQLLLSKKYPTPLSNKKLEIYQPSGLSEGIVILSFNPPESSTATGTTDANGFFKINFYSEGSTQPLKLSSPYGDTSFPVFSRHNFPGLGNSDLYPPTYIGKIIDTVTVSVYSARDIVVTDTFEVSIYTINGRKSKLYYGLQATAGSRLLLDTYTDALCTSFNWDDRKFYGPTSGGLRRYIPFSGQVRTAFSYMVPSEFSEEDESRADIWFSVEP